MSRKKLNKEFPQQLKLSLVIRRPQTLRQDVFKTKSSLFQTLYPRMTHTYESNMDHLLFGQTVNESSCVPESWRLHRSQRRAGFDSRDGRRTRFSCWAGFDSGDGRRTRFSCCELKHKMNVRQGQKSKSLAEGLLGLFV